jgi:hypothetical protein
VICLYCDWPLEEFKQRRYHPACWDKQHNEIAHEEPKPVRVCKTCENPLPEKARKNQIYCDDCKKTNKKSLYGNPGHEKKKPRPSSKRIRNPLLSLGKDYVEMKQAGQIRISAGNGKQIHLEDL